MNMSFMCVTILKSNSWLNNEAVKKGDNKVTSLDVKQKITQIKRTAKCEHIENVVLILNVPEGLENMRLGRLKIRIFLIFKVKQNN